jgi:hypothetical protein
VHTERLPNGTLVYAKDPGAPAANWAWQPTGVQNIHLPERWGVLQFADSADPAVPPPLQRDPAWPVRRALTAVYEAEHVYSTLYGHGFTANVRSLVANAFLAESVAAGKCASTPTIALSPAGGSFVISVSSLDGRISGTITDDRLMSIATKP